MTAPKPWVIVVGTHLVAGAIGWQLAPREMLDSTVQQSGMFTTDTMHILSATVLSLRAESKLRVFSFKGEAHVVVERSSWLFLHGSQELTVPASVGYYVDLSDLTLDRVKYDEASKIVTVSLPPLRLGDIAFQPESARTLNGGLLTYSQDTVDELSRLNYGAARKAFIKQAQGATLVRAAQREAKATIQAHFEIPLRIVGRPDVKVVSTFAPS